ncbi:MAG TPA: hypothetical protein VFA55_00510 [Candidatus Kapabacteria bacterium]|nr:hypothetical protein [Candidatus Kapabacteria bacterium]
MKKLVYCVLFVIISVYSAQAQNIYPMAVGPFITLKGGVNTGTIPNGTKTDFALNSIPDFGATAYFPFSDSSNIGVAVDLGYSTYGIRSKPNTGAVDSNTFDSSYSYLTLSPSLNANVFTLGFNFGIPLAASAKNLSGNQNRNLNTSLLSMLVELRVGAMIPLMNDATGRLDLIVQGGYMLSGMYSSSTSSNPKAASIALGLNYLFSLKKHQ